MENWRLFLLLVLSIAGATTAATTAGTAATTAGATTAATTAGATTAATTAGATTASTVDVTTGPDDTTTAGDGATTATPGGVSCFSCTGFSKESECNKEQASTNSGKVRCQIDEACKIVSTELAGNYTVTRGCIEKCVSSHKERSCQTTTEKGTECNKCCAANSCNSETFSAANRSFGSCVALLVGVLLAALAVL